MLARRIRKTLESLALLTLTIYIYMYIYIYQFPTRRRGDCIDNLNQPCWEIVKGLSAFSGVLSSFILVTLMTQAFQVIGEIPVGRVLLERFRIHHGSYPHSKKQHGEKITIFFSKFDGLETSSR